MANDAVATIKKQFFRPDLVVKYLDRKTYRVLNRFGGTTRKIAQRSMRVKPEGVYQKSGSGKPPFAHGKQNLRKLLFYAFEAGKKTVVVGPVKFERTKSTGVPRIMEFGGSVAAKVRGRSVRKKYKGNPFMKPAFDQVVGKVAGWYKGI